MNPPGDIGLGSKRKATMSQVAAEADVDTSVVSRVLSDDPALSIRPETRQRVLDAVAKLGYRPNVLARGLRTQAAGAIGLILPSFYNPIYGELIEGATLAARELDLSIVTAFPGDDVASVGYLRLLDESRVDGLLISVGASAEAIAELERRGHPWLLLNRRGVSGRRYLILDDEGAARIATEHLLELGHRRFAHIGGPLTADTADRRLSGFNQALSAAGLEAVTGGVARHNYTSAGGAEAMHQILALRERPTAVVVANVTAAIGALSVAWTSGVSIPRDMSIVALHDLPLADHTVPALTTVSLPLVALGRRGIEHLAGEGARTPIEEIVDGDMQLVVRSSTDRPPQS